MRKGWRGLGLFSLEKTRLEGISSMYVDILKGGYKEVKLGSFQWRPVTAVEVVGSN